MYATRAASDASTRATRGARREPGHEAPADVALLVLDEGVEPRVERAPGPGALRLEGRVRRLRRALEVPKDRAAVRRERLEVENLIILGCERPQRARLADARAAAADDYHARALLEQLPQVPPVGAVAAVEHEDVDVSSRQQPRHRSRLLMSRLLVPRLLPIMVLLLAVWVLRRPLAQPVAVLARGAARGLSDVGARRATQPRSCAAHCVLPSRRRRRVQHRHRTLQTAELDLALRAAV